MISKSSRSLRGTHGPDFEVLDARSASALNKIIQNARFKEKVSLEEMKVQKEDRFLRGRQICSPDLRILPGHWGQWFCRKSCRAIYRSLFKVTIFRSSIQNGMKIYFRCHKSQLDDILEGFVQLKSARV